ncbi:MAG: hypothetical protein ACREBC_30600, partial [Pyrinomonadaceae bacterium]
ELLGQVAAFKLKLLGRRVVTAAQRKAQDTCLLDDVGTTRPFGSAPSRLRGSLIEKIFFTGTRGDLFWNKSGVYVTCCNNVNSATVAA